jgi:hypothetical protein
MTMPALVQLRIANAEWHTGLDLRCPAAAPTFTHLRAPVTSMSGQYDTSAYRAVVGCDVAIQVTSMTAVSE